MRGSRHSWLSHCTPTFSWGAENMMAAQPLLQLSDTSPNPAFQAQAVLHLTWGKGRALVTLPRVTRRSGVCPAGHRCGKACCTASRVQCNVSMLGKTPISPALAGFQTEAEHLCSTTLQTSGTATFADTDVNARGLCNNCMLLMIARCANMVSRLSWPHVDNMAVLHALSH